MRFLPELNPVPLVFCQLRAECPADPARDGPADDPGDFPVLVILEILSLRIGDGQVGRSGLILIQIPLVIPLADPAAQIHFRIAGARRKVSEFLQKFIGFGRLDDFVLYSAERIRR